SSRRTIQPGKAGVKLLLRRRPQHAVVFCAVILLLALVGLLREIGAGFQRRPQRLVRLDLLRLAPARRVIFLDHVVDGDIEEVIKEFIALGPRQLVGIGLCRSRLLARWLLCGGRGGRGRLIHFVAAASHGSDGAYDEGRGSSKESSWHRD